MLKSGNDVILSREDDGAYLNYRQCDDEYEPGDSGVTTLKASYLSKLHYDAEGGSGKIIGGQGNLWTEKIIFPKNATYMLFPRLAAIAECYWLADGRNWESFENRVKELPLLLEALGLGISFFIPDYFST